MSQPPAGLSRRAFGAIAAALILQPRRALAATPIDYWHHFTSPSEFAGLRAVLELFAAERAGTAIRQDAIPNPDFMTKFTAAALAGGLPDVTMVTTERLPDMLALGGLVDIAGRVAAWPGRAALPPDRWIGAQRGGGLYGVPAFAFIDWLYYRKDWFEEAGIAEPPATFEEFRSVALRLTDPSRGRFGFGMRAGPGGAKYVIDVMEAFGAPAWSGSQVAFDRKAAAEALRFYAGLSTQDHVVPPSAPGDGYRQVMEAFRAGRTAMVWHHTGSLREIAAALQPGSGFATAPIPAGPVSRIARVSFLYHGLASDESGDAAFDFARFWGSDAAARAFHAATGFIPASRTVAGEPAIAGNPIYAAALETLRFGRPPPSFPGAPAFAETVVLPAFQALLGGGTSVDQAVEEIERGLDAVAARGR